MELKKITGKKILLLIGIALDVGLTIFLLVISIIMLSSTIGKGPSDIQDADGLIGYLQNNPTFYGLVFVLPLFVLLAVNIIGLVIYVRKSAKRETPKVADLSEEQKEALRKELLKDLQNEDNKE